MAKNSMAAADALRKIIGDDHTDMLKDALKQMLSEIMEVEVGRMTGATLHEHSDERLAHRNGYRERRFDTRMGSIDLEIPKLRKGSYFPSFLEPRRRAEKALMAVIQEAYVLGVSTRKVEDLLAQLGITNCSKSEVSRICLALDVEVEAFRTRPLDGPYPYLWLDATYQKVREGGRVVSNAIVVAYAVNADGFREVVGVSIGPSETEAFWTEFLRELKARGLSGVQLVISDAHNGLQTAISKVLTGASWQRCYVHFLRNVQGRVAKSQAGMVSEAIRTIFSQPNGTEARAQLRRVADSLRKAHPAVADMLEAAEADLLAYFGFPEAHRKQIRSTNPLERLNKEIKRRTDVVGIFPNRKALLRLVGMVLVEQHEEWQVGRRYLSGDLRNLVAPPTVELLALEAA